MWRVDPNNPNPTLGHRAELCFKIYICCVLGLGVLYAILIVNTLRQYGSAMDKSWRDRIADFRSEQARKASQTPVLSPLFGVQLIEPTPPHTFSRLSTASPRQAYRPSSPRAANQAFAPQNIFFIPGRPLMATEQTRDLRESFESYNPPSPTDFARPQMCHGFSASPTAMTPEPTTPPQKSRKLTHDEVCGTSGARNGSLGLIFDADREGLEEAVSITGLDDGIKNNTRQRNVESGTSTDPDSDTTLVIQATESEDNDPINSDERVGAGLNELESQSLGHFRPDSSHTSHLSS